jgi:hypothetical protein
MAREAALPTVVMALVEDGEVLGGSHTMAGCHRIPLYSSQRSNCGDYNIITIYKRKGNNPENKPIDPMVNAG